MSWFAWVRGAKSSMQRSVRKNKKKGRKEKNPQDIFLRVFLLELNIVYLPRSRGLADDVNVFVGSIRAFGEMGATTHFLLGVSLMSSGFTYREIGLSIS